MSDYLLVRMGPWVCGLPLPNVREVLRPLELKPLGGAPAVVSGVSRIRGRAVPVLDLRSALESEAPGKAALWIHLEVDGKPVALAADGVIGVRPTSEDRPAPAFLQAAPAGALDRLGTADDELVALLDGLRLIPPEAREAPQGDEGSR